MSLKVYKFRFHSNSETTKDNEKYYSMQIKALIRIGGKFHENIRLNFQISPCRPLESVSQLCNNVNAIQEGLPIIEALTSCEKQEELLVSIPFRY